MLTVLKGGGIASTLLFCLVVGTSPAAFADNGEVIQPPPSVPTTTGGTIVVKVSGTALKNGSPGHVTSREVSVPSPCWMEPSFTGKDYYEFVTGTGKYALRGGMNWVNAHMGEELTAQPGYEQYKDDTTGHWWGGRCSSGNYSGSIQDFFVTADAFFKAHPLIFIPAGRPVPVPPVPPEVLRDAAIAEMQLPTPVIDWNPKQAGTNGTFVNLDTWVWLTDRREDLYVEATADTMGGPTSARVDVHLTGMTVSAPGGESVSCEGPGVPYTRGAVGACAIMFRQPSVAAAGTPVTTQTTWHGTWSANGEARGDIPTQPVVPPSATNVRVDERQTINR